MPLGITVTAVTKVYKLINNIRVTDCYSSCVVLFLCIDYILIDILSDVWQLYEKLNCPQGLSIAFLMTVFTDAEIIVVCGENYIEVRALEEFFNYYKAKLGSLHLPNGKCRANETTIDGKKYYYSRTSKEDYSRCGGKPFEVQQRNWCKACFCMLWAYISLQLGFYFYFFNFVPSMQKNFTHIKYSLKLSSDPEVFNNIIRDSTISLEYSCTFPYTRKVSLDFPIVPFSK